MWKVIGQVWTSSQTSSLKESEGLTCSLHLGAGGPVSMVINRCDLDPVFCVCQQRLQDRPSLARREESLQRAQGQSKVSPGSVQGQQKDLCPPRPPRPPSTHRLLVSSSAAVAQAVVLQAAGVQRLPGNPHAEGGLLVHPDAPQGGARSWGSRDTDQFSSSGAGMFPFAPPGGSTRSWPFLTVCAGGCRSNRGCKGD